MSGGPTFSGTSGGRALCAKSVLEDMSGWLRTRILLYPQIGLTLGVVFVRHALRSANGR